MADLEMPGGLVQTVLRPSPGMVLVLVVLILSGQFGEIALGTCLILTLS